MAQSIKLSTDQMRMMSLFQNVTGAVARDCIEDEKQNRVIFVVNTGKMGLAIGKRWYAYQILTKYGKTKC